MLSLYLQLKDFRCLVFFSSVFQSTKPPTSKAQTYFTLDNILLKIPVVSTVLHKLTIVTTAKNKIQTYTENTENLHTVWLKIQINKASRPFV